MTSKLEIPETQVVDLSVKIAITTALAAAFFLAFTPILIRISESFISPNATIFHRFWIATAILGLWQVVFLRNRQANLPIKKFTEINKIWLPLAVMAIAFVSTQLLWATSIAQTTVANSEVLHCLSPGFTTLAAWALFSQKFGGRFITGMVVATGGTIAIGFSDMFSSISLAGDGLAFLSAIFWGGYIMSMEKLRTWLSPTVILIWASGSCTLLSLGVLIITGDRLFPSSGAAWLTLIVMAFNTIIAHSLIAYSIKWLSSGLMTTILLISPVITAIMGWFLFSETLTLLNLLGFAVILVGIYLAISDTGELKVLEE
ncbi:DMT family transporter [Limnofasciculus baicalensis]|uniref:DMT family transporter n=1 Tax=Limnofasciculus baicalensis BBK-W-15 TaxID=2699891 RepID=A0AAE3GMZ4_9CYAN|nr:DMT family transporter [Limnofasciculus baicalensis]MCP2727586.1 DMT family transporter [Limnofasciculus baicalensis BBK-W-15]